MAARSYGQYCGVTRAVELVGERWALLIVRDLLVGPRRYTDLKRGLPRIPTNILAARLSDLQAGGIIRRVPMVHSGLVYELTPYGCGLEPIILALGRWGFSAMGDPREGDVITADSLTMALRTAFRPEVAALLARTVYEVHVAHVSLHVSVDGEDLRIAALGESAPPASPQPPDTAADLVIVASPRLREVIAGTLTAEEAIDTGAVVVTAGDPMLLEAFTRTFHIDSVRIAPTPSQRD